MRRAAGRRGPTPLPTRDDLASTDGPHRGRRAHHRQPRHAKTAVKRRGGRNARRATPPPPQRGRGRAPLDHRLGGRGTAKRGWMAKGVGGSAVVAGATLPAAAGGGGGGGGGSHRPAFPTGGCPTGYRPAIPQQARRVDDPRPRSRRGRRPPTGAPTPSPLTRETPRRRRAADGWPPLPPPTPSAVTLPPFPPTQAAAACTTHPPCPSHRPEWYAVTRRPSATPIPTGAQKKKAHAAAAEPPLENVPTRAMVTPPAYLAAKVSRGGVCPSARRRVVLRRRPDRRNGRSTAARRRRRGL